MTAYNYKTKGTCSQMIHVEIEDGKIYNVSFLGGCNGNLKGIGKLIEEGAVFKVVMENGSIIGFCEYKKEEERLFLSKLYARKDQRGKGVGRFMFEDVKKYAIENGLNKIYLTVNKGNTPSYQIYLHLGFKVIDSVVNDIGHGYVMDDYIMEYTIDA